MTTPPRPPPISPVALHNRLNRTYMIATAAALATGALLFFFGLDLTTRQAWLLFLVIAPLALLPTVITDLYVLNRHIRPIKAALRPDVERDTVARAVVQALNLPWLTARRLIFVHFPIVFVAISLIAWAANVGLDFGLNWNQYIILSLIAVLLSAGHALFEYFLTDHAIRSVIPWLWQTAGELKPDERRRITSLGMRRKLLSVSVFAVLTPLIFLGVTTLVRVNELLLGQNISSARAAELLVPLQIWVFLLIVVSLAAMLALSVVMARGVTRAADEMAQAMQTVEDGNLEARLDIITTDEFARLFDGFNHMTEGLRERERLRDAFGRYLAPELAEAVMKRGVRLGGDTIEASVLFADIRGFTTISEGLQSEQVVDLLNRYFAAVEPVIQAHGGWINKFGGDSLLAVFGAPVPHPDHARRALLAALGMRAALAEFNQHQQAQGGPLIHIGMGLHTGSLVAGNVGSPTRMEYTVIGDIVNVASRIDGLNKEWHTDLLVSAEALAAAGLDIPVRAMPPVAVKGKSHTIQVYAPEPAVAEIEKAHPQVTQMS